MSESRDLEQEIQQLREEVATLRRRLDPVERDLGVQVRGRSTRRGAIGLVAGAAAGAFVGARPVGAANGAPVNAGETTVSTQTTELRYPASLGISNPRSHVFAVQDGVWATGVPDEQTVAETGRRAVIGAYAGNDAMNGVYSITTGSTPGASGAKFFGEGPDTYGIVVGGRRAPLRFVRQQGVQPPPPDLFNLHNEGEVVIDDNRDLWFCVESGRPGVWRRLSGPGTAGSLTAITPVRVFDSRLGSIPSSGLLGASAVRTVSVAHAYDARGVRTITDVIPRGTTAVIANVTATRQSGRNFLAVVPGGVTSSTTSSLNWGDASPAVANSITVGIDSNRFINVLVGPTGSTHVIVDITGYYR